MPTGSRVPTVVAVREVTIDRRTLSPVGSSVRLGTSSLTRLRRAQQEFHLHGVERELDVPIGYRDQHPCFQ